MTMRKSQRLLLIGCSETSFFRLASSFKLSALIGQTNQRQCSYWSASSKQQSDWPVNIEPALWLVDQFKSSTLIGWPTHMQQSDWLNHWKTAHWLADRFKCSTLFGWPIQMQKSDWVNHWKTALWLAESKGSTPIDWPIQMQQSDWLTHSNAALWLANPFKSSTLIGWPIQTQRSDWLIHSTSVRWLASLFDQSEHAGCLDLDIELLLAVCMSLRQTISARAHGRLF